MHDRKKDLYNKQKILPAEISAGSTSVSKKYFDTLKPTFQNFKKVLKSGSIERERDP